jgi:hypothetical protein
MFKFGSKVSLKEGSFPHPPSPHIKKSFSAIAYETGFHHPTLDWLGPSEKKVIVCRCDGM